MSKKPTEATQNLRDKAEDYISSLEGEGRFTLPELIEHLEAEHPDVISKVNNLRVTVANTLKHFDGSVILNTGEKDAESKRKGPNPVVWRRMTDDDHLRVEFQKQQMKEDAEQPSSSSEEQQEEESQESPSSDDFQEPDKEFSDEDFKKAEEQFGHPDYEEPMHEDIESAKEEAETEQVETDSSSEEFDF